MTDIIPLALVFKACSVTAPGLYIEPERRTADSFPVSPVMQTDKDVLSLKTESRKPVVSFPKCSNIGGFSGTVSSGS